MTIHPTFPSPSPKALKLAPLQPPKRKRLLQHPNLFVVEVEVAHLEDIVKKNDPNLPNDLVPDFLLSMDYLLVVLVVRKVR